MIPLPKVIKRDIVAMPMPKDRKSLADIENDKKMKDFMRQKERNRALEATNNSEVVTLHT